MKCILIFIFSILISNIVLCQELPIEYNVKYYERLKQIDFKQSFNDDIWFFEFSEDKLITFFDFDGNILGSETYRIEYINPKPNLNVEDSLCRWNYKLTISDSLHIGYFNDPKFGALTCFSSPIISNNRIHYRFHTNIYKSQKTKPKINIKLLNRRKKQSKWDTKRIIYPKIYISNKTLDSKYYGKLSLIDGCLFVLVKDLNSESFHKQKMYRVHSFDKKRMVVVYQEHSKKYGFIEYLLLNRKGNYKKLRN